MDFPRRTTGYLLRLAGRHGGHRLRYGPRKRRVLQRDQLLPASEFGREAGDTSLHRRKLRRGIISSQRPAMGAPPQMV